MTLRKTIQIRSSIHRARIVCVITDGRKVVDVNSRVLVVDAVSAYTQETMEDACAYVFHDISN